MDVRKQMRRRAALVLLTGALATNATAADAVDPRPRARDAGVVIGVMETGALNAIVDVPGVQAPRPMTARVTSATRSRASRTGGWRRMTSALAASSRSSGE